MPKVLQNRNALAPLPRNLNAPREHVALPENLNALRRFNGDGGGGGVPVAPGVVYNPNDSFDRSLVQSNPLARQMLAGKTAAMDWMAAMTYAAQGNFPMAAAETTAMWQAWAGVVNPFAY
jgi:hypothetical protein